MYPGFPTRMQVELDKYYRTYLKKNADDPLNIKIVVQDSPNRKYNVFFGGCVYSTTFLDPKDLWISHQEYKEKGVKRVMKEKGNCIVG